jgi:hypothetical protein
MLAPTPHEIKSQAYALHYGSARTPIAVIVPDSVYPGVYRIRWPSGELSDMVNLSRAKDAALAICERGPPRRDPRLFRWKLDAHERPTKASSARLDVGQAIPLAGAQT